MQKTVGKMGFKKPDLESVRWAIQKSLIEIHNDRNDGFTQMSCKKDLYLLKCWLDDRYMHCPTFTGEEQWDQDRIVEILKSE